MRINRDEVIMRMNAAKIEYVSLYKDIQDKLAALYHLTPSGKLVDYNNKAVPKSATFEGWMKYNQEIQKPLHIPFTEEITNIG